MKIPPDQSNPFILKDGINLTPDSEKPPRHKKSAVTYKIVCRIPSQAFHSYSYRAVKLVGGRQTNDAVFIKTPLLKPGTAEEERLRNAHVGKTFFREIEKQERLKNIQHVSHYIGMGRHQVTRHGVQMEVPFLAQQFIGGTRLDAYFVEDEATRTGNLFSGVKTAEDWFRHARSLLTVLKRVHNQQIVHGDLGPRNIHIVKERGADGTETTTPYIVDFGQSFFIDQDSARPGKGEAQPEVLAYRAPERERDSSWQIPADIYCMGAVLYYLAAGSPPPQKAKSAKDVEALKKYIHEGIFKANPGLLRQNEGIVKIIDKCLRNDPHDRYFCAENILADLDTFEHKAEPTTISLKQFDILFATIKQTFDVTNANPGNNLFGAIILKDLDMLAKKSESMQRDHFEIYGDRDEIIDHLCRYLSTLRQGDEYLTVTQPSYWSKNNLGTNGRFFTMNKIMARRGVVIRRVFLLSEEDKRVDSEAWQTILAHDEAARELSEEGIDVISSSLPNSASLESQRSFYTGYKLMKPEERTTYFEDEGNHVALWRRVNGKMMSIVFSTKPLEHSSRRREGAQISLNDQQIVKVRFWVSDRLIPAFDNLRQKFIESTPLRKLIEEVVNEERPLAKSNRKSAKSTTVNGRSRTSTSNPKRP